MENNNNVFSSLTPYYSVILSGQNLNHKRHSFITFLWAPKLLNTTHWFHTKSLTKSCKRALSSVQKSSQVSLGLTSLIFFFFSQISIQSSPSSLSQITNKLDTGNVSYTSLAPLPLQLEKHHFFEILTNLCIHV